MKRVLSYCGLSVGIGFFLTKIFHPNVAHNGAICVNTLKRDWKPDHGVKHILLVRYTNTCTMYFCIGIVCSLLLLKNFETVFFGPVADSCKWCV